MKRLSVAVLMWTLPLFGGVDRHQSCFPKNNLDKQDNLNTLTGHVNEDAFDKIIDQVTAVYKPIVAAHGAILQVQKDWTDATVNAYADRDGNNWTVAMFGGLARRPEITPDGFALTICHELGHHLGGFAFKAGRWAASEGQSDYFAAQACAKKIWSSQLATNATFRRAVPSLVQAKCNRSYRTVKTQNLCYRTAQAGKSLGTMLAKLAEQPAPKFEKPDTNLVSMNFDSHPSGQCRLDTYFSAALCPIAFPDEQIPGFEHPNGQDSVGAEDDAAKVSCTDSQFHTFGQRPRCWFAPQIDLKVDPSMMTKTELSGDHDEIWEPGETFAVNLPIKNSLLSAVEGATLTVTGPNTVETVKYPVIQTGETAYAESGISIAQARSRPCGARFSLNAKIAVNNWSTEKKIALQLGKAISAENITEVPNLSIPDNDPKGIARTLDATSSKKTSLVKVTVDITHDYVGDLQLTLISPSNREYLFYDKVGGDDASIVQTFEVPVTAEKISGTWKLKVADFQDEDFGTLNSWGLDFTVMDCQAGLQLLTTK